MKEAWKPVSGFEGYYKVSNLGRVKSMRSGHLLKPSFFTGYGVVTFSVEGKTSYYKLHRLVAQEFLPNPESKPAVNHKDANKVNNSATNLEWCTPAENNAHAGHMNLKPIGTAHKNSKFTKQDLLEINFLYHRFKMSSSAIGSMYGADRHTVMSAINGRTYSKEHFNE